MRTRVLLLVATVAARPPVVGAQHAAPLQSPGGRALTPRDSAVHTLNRLAYGPRPDEIERVARAGVLRWIDAQLTPDKIDDKDLARRERQFDVLTYDRGDLATLYAAVQRARQERKRMGDTAADKPDDSPVAVKGRRFAAQVQQLAVVRAALSERQLYEVMVDFWTNHFNVYFAKGADRFLTPDYIEHTIRPHAMGRFEDLLIATARSPAMLFYLDNWESVAPGASPPVPLSARRRGGQGVRRMPKGINENYARELLELHTLGVDGGYTQQDVVEVARAFTGWTILPVRPQAREAAEMRLARAERAGGLGFRQEGDFLFRADAHDAAPKKVLGTQLPAGRGIEDGEAVLDLLAAQKATAKHISTKLAVRFVSDHPPQALIDRLTDVYLTTHGDVRRMIVAIAESPEFWGRDAVGSKIKSPFELTASALRVTGG